MCKPIVRGAARLALTCERSFRSARLWRVSRAYPRRFAVVLLNVLHVLCKARTNLSPNATLACCVHECECVSKLKTPALHQRQKAQRRARGHHDLLHVYGFCLDNLLRLCADRKKTHYANKHNARPVQQQTAILNDILDCP